MTKNIIVVISVICTIWSLITLEFFKEPMLVNYHNFPLTITSKQYYKDSTKLNKHLSQIKNKKIYLLRGSENYFYKIINDEKLNYYDLPNYGNYGYNGEKKIKNKLKKEKNCLFVIDSTLVDNKDKNQQYIKEYANLIKKNNKLIKKVGVYEVYEAK